MSHDARQELGELLRELRGDGSFATRRTAPVDDLRITVSGVGAIGLPVSAAQAKELRLVARPAKYGHGELTIHDRRVRDTWEVPRTRVKIDRRQWNRTLHPMLDAIRDDLGLPTTASLSAELHSMLVYEPGQFFAAHQDSEKSDEMIGSLVVMLPSNSTGGALVVEHRGESAEYRGSTSALTFVAFYADTRHEVLPVERGYRVVLTYNLMLTGDATPSPSDARALSAAVAALMDRHFTRTPTPRWHGDRDAMEPPDRLVVLLDHRYTARGLSWSHLKGDDAARAAILRDAAITSTCEIALAHAEIHETWDAHEPEPRGWGRSSWDDFDGDDFDDGIDEGGGDRELGDLIDSSVTISPTRGARVAFDTHVSEAELATPTPSAELTPDQTEYTGYMGNWGNTLDRWYRRAAIVVWPRGRTFALRAKADPIGAIDELLAPNASDRADDVATLLRFWSDGVRSTDQRALLPQTLRLAWQLGDDGLATRLLEPFSIEAIAPSDATVIATLIDQHGVQWFDRQIDAWMPRRSAPRAATTPTRAAWVEALPELCVNLRDDPPARAGPGADGARALVRRVWGWLDEAVGAASAEATPSRRDALLGDLGGPTLAVLRATAIVEDPELQRRVLDTLTDETLDVTPLLVAVVEAALVDPGGELEASGILDVAARCEAALVTELATPERDPSDWSILQRASELCCDDCAHLDRFLADAAEQKLVWPLAKPRRQHIHQRIDRAELPVTHATVRRGSPHQLVLTKTKDLFRREAEQREQARARLTTVQRLLGTHR